MKNLLLIVSVFFGGVVGSVAYATPATMDFSCSDSEGNSISWDAIQGYDGSRVQTINGHITVENEGVKVSILPEAVLATPRSPNLLMHGEDGQYIVVSPKGTLVDAGDRIHSAAYVEFAIKGPKGLLKLKRTKMKCSGSNDA